MQHGFRPSRILTSAAFDNAIRVLMAIGGSTNGVLHLQAIAAELDLEIRPERFNELSRSTPFICDVCPSGSGGHFMADLDEAGGIAGVMKVLQPLLDSDVFTVTGHAAVAAIFMATVRQGLAGQDRFNHRWPFFRYRQGLCASPVPRSAAFCRPSERPLRPGIAL